MLKNSERFFYEFTILRHFKIIINMENQENQPQVQGFYSTPTTEVQGFSTEESTPQTEYKVSNVFRRSLAYFIDQWYISMLAGIILAPIMAIFGVQRFSGGLQTASISFTNPIVLGLYLGVTGVSLLKDFKNGISPGKWALGIMVRSDKDNEKTPSIGEVIIRNLFLIIYFIEFWVAIFAPRRKRIGDMVAKTVVLKNPNRPGRAKRFFVTLGVMVLLMIIYGLVSVVVQRLMY